METWHQSLKDKIRETLADRAITRAENKIGITGLKEAFYKALESDEAIVLAEASIGNKLTKVFMHAYYHDGKNEPAKDREPGTVYVLT